MAEPTKRTTVVAPAKQPRKREPWRTEERAIDTDEAMALSQRRAQRSDARPGWGQLVGETKEQLGLDIQPLCNEFDAANRGYLPRGMVHMWIEPVLSHFTQHVCWREPAVEEVCGFARSLYVLGTAMQHQRMEAWRARALHVVADHRDSAKLALARFMGEQEALRLSFNDEHAVPEVQAGLLADINKHAHFHERYVQACDETIERHAGATHLLADREDGRPGLVFAEAELLAISTIDAKRVSELIVELRNRSDRSKQVRSRALLDTFALHLKIVR